MTETKLHFSQKTKTKIKWKFAVKINNAGEYKNIVLIDLKKSCGLEVTTLSIGAYMRNMYCIDTDFINWLGSNFKSFGV